MRDEPERLDASAEVMRVARNIVNVIGECFYDKIPSAEWVRVRQETNDELDSFVASLIGALLSMSRREQ